VQWSTSFTAGAANVYVDLGSRCMILTTFPNTACASAEALGVAQAKIAPGVTLIFEAVLETYHDQAIYGNYQSRGLRSGDVQSHSERGNSARWPARRSTR